MHEPDRLGVAGQVDEVVLAVRVDLAGDLHGRQAQADELRRDVALEAEDRAP